MANTAALRSDTLTLPKVKMTSPRAGNFLFASKASSRMVLYWLIVVKRKYFQWLSRVLDRLHIFFHKPAIWICREHTLHQNPGPWPSSLLPRADKRPRPWRQTWLRPGHRFAPNDECGWAF